MPKAVEVSRNCRQWVMPSSHRRRSVVSPIPFRKMNEHSSMTESCGPLFLVFAFRNTLQLVSGKFKEMGHLFMGEGVVRGYGRETKAD